MTRTEQNRVVAWRLKVLREFPPTFNIGSRKIAQKSRSHIQLASAPTFQAHFIARSAATSSGRIIHSACALVASSGLSRPVDSVNHQHGVPFPAFGGA